MRAVLSLLIIVLLAGCSTQPVRVGSKDLVENRILAEMFALLLEEQNIKVKRLPAFESTEIISLALRDDDIDVYPEYTGTVLAFMGAPRIDDGDEAFALASEGLSQHGLVLLDRLGFDSSYAVLTRASIASENDLAAISDLAGPGTGLRLGVTQSFAERPRDGLDPFLDRFGLVFDDIEIFAEADREDIYDALVDRRVDVIVGFTTAPEIADYELVQLEDSTDFFSLYEAAPLTSDAALERTPEIATMLSGLADRIDDSMMRELIGAVRLDGRPVTRVARQALFDLGLVARPPRERTPVLGIAMGPEIVGTDVGVATLRAVRKAVRGRDVDLLAYNVPLAAMAAGEARLALTPAVSSFTMRDGKLVRDDRVEAIAAIGSTFLHALSSSENPVAPMNAETIASGPEGSPSHTLAMVIAGVGGSGATVIPLGDDSPQTAAVAVRDGRADVALVFAAPGRSDIIDVLSSGDDITLVGFDGWWDSAARLSLPVMREAQINADTYPGINQPVATLSTQLILFGPAPSERFVFGQQGPSSFFDEVRPLQDRTVEAINANLGVHASVDPHLRRANALTPQVNARDDRINPFPERTFLMVAFLAYLAWAMWLLIRPDTPAAKEKRRSQPNGGR